MNYRIKSNLIDLHDKTIYPAELRIEEGIITEIIPLNEKQSTYILPGFIDAHVHIESSMLIPSEFARLAVLHGTVGTISDPHEIANVMGIEGVNFMIENGNKVPFHFFFGAPSCVPATAFETAGASIDSKGIDELLKRPEIIYLAEMMNFPGVIHKDPEVMAKLALAEKYNKPVDGHAPGLRGEELRKYISTGISTDHECFSYEEAKEKLELGMKIMIREGSAARNFEALIPLLSGFPDQIMFCSDDKHPDGLIVSHINDHVKRALKKGHDLFQVLRASSVNVINHYNLPVGQLRKGDNADFIEIDSIENFNILRTFISGKCVAEKGRSSIERTAVSLINNFRCSLKRPSDFELSAGSGNVKVIEVLDGQLITKQVNADILVRNGKAESDIKNDILKIAVVNRYENTSPAIAFIKNTGLKKGAIASCVAHDCHNIVVTGTSDAAICKAVNLIIRSKGGISYADEQEERILPLPIGGIMSDCDAYEIARQYIALDKKAKDAGSNLSAPYMSLSFMALLVIPALKLSDKGLFDGTTFSFVDVFNKSEAAEL
ncbi:MAG: adenine deaminase [Bacteroidia bacterium]